jgi:tetratricopeptide (TPR) repeat protein
MGVRAELHMMGAGASQVYLLDVPRLTVGRTRENLLTISDPAISRHHAEFIRLGDDVLLRDLGSTNGSFINSVRISEQLLNEGDIVRFGPQGQEFQFAIVDESGTPTQDPPRPRRDPTGSLIESLSGRLVSTGGDVCEDASLRSVLAEAYLTKGNHAEALRLLSRYNDPAALLALPLAYRAGVLLWLGRAYIESKQFGLATETLERGLNLATRENDENAIAEAHASMGRALMGMKDLLAARDNLNRAMLTARRGGNSRLGAEVHLWLGKVDWKDGDFDGARYNWTRATRLAEGLNAPLLQARVQLQQAFVLYAEGKLKEAVPVYEGAIERIKAIGNLPLLLKAYSSLSRALVRLGQWSSAERLLDDRLAMARENKINKAEAVALTDHAELELLQGRLQAAVTSIEAANEAHGKHVYARTQRILGRILVVRGQVQEGIKALEAGLVASRESGALEEQILIGVELSLAHLDAGQIEDARARLDEAEATTPLDPALTLMGRALFARGSVHAAANQIGEANRAFAQCLAIFQTTGDPYRIGLCQAAIGELRAKVGRDDSARGHFEEAQRQFVKLGAVAELRRVESRLTSSALAGAAPKLTSATRQLSKTARLSLEHLTSALGTGSLLIPTAAKILVAVGSDDLAGLLFKGLEVENYIVTRVQDGQAVFEKVTSNGSAYHLLILDALLEHRSGFDICRELRKRKLETPVILLGARQGLEDKIEALQAGADDFLSKRNLVFEELLAKIDALLR